MSGAISAAFHDDLTQGKLSLLADRVRRDDTLMLALRGDSINLYYRGGSILRVARNNGTGRYTAHFDSNYAKGWQGTVPATPAVIETKADCDAWLQVMPTLKEIMNSFFAAHTKSEREFQQLVAWENNRSGIANSTEYFITDIEYADARHSARLDMLGVKWLSTDRKDGSNCVPVFIEMKYGIGAYDGEAGIAKHIDDLRKILRDADTRDALNRIIAEQFRQLDDLGLVQFNRSKRFERINVSGRPEVVFLLANHNPRSRKLLSALETIEESPDFDLRFFVATFAGYGMHQASMLNLSEFKERVSGYLTSAI